MSNAGELVARLAEAGIDAHLLSDVAQALFTGEEQVKLLDQRREADRKRQVKRKALMPKDWDALRGQIFERDGFACTYCGAEKNLQCDHIIPMSRGGDNSPENLTTACKTCNSSKGARTPEEWRAA